MAAASTRRRLPLALVVAAGTGLLLAGFTAGDPVLLVVFGVAGLALGLPALRALTPPGTLRVARGLPAAVLMRGILTFTFFGIDAYVALTLVEGRQWTAIEAGIALTAATLAWTSGSWIQAHFAPRFAPEWFVRTGLAVVVVGLTLFTLVLLPAVPAWVAIPTFAIAGLGMGLAYSPLALIVLREAPPAEQGSASSAISLLDSLGTALGTGVTGALVAASVRIDGEATRGLALGFGVSIAVGCIGMLLSGRLWPKRVRTRAPAAVVTTG